MNPADLKVLDDGRISFTITLDPEVYGMLIKYKKIKATTSVPVISTINNILKDFLIERLSRPSTHSTIKTLNTFDEFDIEPGK